MRHFTSGWHRQAHDPRDHYLIVPSRRAAAAPAWQDNAGGMGPLLDQGDLGSCGPNTADEMLTYDQLAQGQPAAGASRLFIYWYTRYLQGTVSSDSGVDNRTMLKALASYGFPPEALWPYDDTPASMVRQPTPDVVAAARPNAITDYAAVVQSLTQMKGVLAMGKVFMFGFDCYAQIESDAAAETGVVADPPAGATPIGGHDVTFLGYSDTARPGVKPGNVWPAGFFKFRNHWKKADGSWWGDEGHGYVSYDYATNAQYSSDFWAIFTVPGGVTPPPPPPPAGKVTFSFPYDGKTAGPVTVA